MRSQWDCLLQNLGEWQGSFTHFSPQGEWVDDVPTLVTLEGLNQNQTVRQLVRRYLPNETQDKWFEYSFLSRGILFFEEGAFSQGSLQFAPFSEFGAELGLIWGDLRLRLVQMFDRSSQLQQLTLVREHRVGTPGVETPALTLEHLLGTWQGEAVTLYPDWRSPDTLTTQLELSLQSPDRLSQQLSFTVGGENRTIASTAQIQGNRLLFDQGNQVQVLLLPGGASCTCPLQVKFGQPFFLEMGWLIEPGLRQRLIRRYDEKGGWISLTLVTERKLA